MTTLVRLTDEQMAEAKKLCVELPIIEDRLRRAGLYATAAAVNMAVVKIGYEVCVVMPPNAKSEPTARLFAQVGSTDGLCSSAPDKGGK